MLLKGLVSLLLIGSNAFAEENYTISQIVLNQHRAVVKASSSVVGDVFLVTQDGQQCSLKVLSASPKAATLDTSNCAFENSLKIGQTLERSLIEEPVAAQTTAPLPVSSINSELKKPDLNKALCAHKVMDSHPMPCAGRAFVTPSYVFESYKSSNPAANTEITRKVMDLEVEYGLLDTWSVSASNEFTFSQERERQFKMFGEKRTVESEGLSNPWFNTQVRLLDQSTGDSANWGAGLGYSPDVVTWKNATNESKGTLGFGGERFSADTFLSEKIGNAEFGANVGYTQKGERKAKDQFPYRENGGNVLALGLFNRINIAKDSYTTFKLTRRQVEKATATDERGSSNFGAYGVTVLGVGLSTYLPDSNMKCFFLGDYSLIEDQDVLDYKVENRKQVSLSAGVSVAL
jgi:hypothetical protein